MPAVAVIKAPIAYVKVFAVKKLVVGFWFWIEGSLPGAQSRSKQPQQPSGLHGILFIECPAWPTEFTFKRIKCSKQATLMAQMPLHEIME